MQNGCTVWSSSNVTYHQAINPQNSDIIEVRCTHTTSERVSLILKAPTQICGQTAFHTAVHEIYVVFIEEHDAPLEVEDIHNDELSQWVNMKSLLMSSVTSTELSQDHDFNYISYKICENNRQLLTTQLCEINEEG